MIWVSDITISSTREQDLYTLSYANSDRQLAKRVVQSLLTIFVESTLGEKREETDSAQEFVEQQIKEYEAKLEAAELRLAEFKRTHMGMMPGSEQDYYGQLQEAKSDLQQAQLSLSEAVNQRNQFKQQMEDDEDSYLMFSELQPGVGSALDMRIQELYGAHGRTADQVHREASRCGRNKKSACRTGTKARGRTCVDG